MLFVSVRDIRVLLFLERKKWDPFYRSAEFFFYFVLLPNITCLFLSVLIFALTVLIVSFLLLLQRIGYNIGIENLPILRNLETQEQREAELFRHKYIRMMKGEFFYKKPIMDLEMKSVFEEAHREKLDISKAFSCDQKLREPIFEVERKTFEDICSICFTQFNDLSFILTLPECKHTFHFNCVMLWIKNHPNCPCCRSNLVEYFEKQENQNVAPHFS